MTEESRGCGYRQIGGAYLTGSGIPIACDGLPVPLDPCGDCGYVVPFSRGMQLIHMGYLKRAERETHKDHPCTDTLRPCPICDIEQNEDTEFAIMYVSHNFYTQKSFIEEAIKLGVSKRIAPHSVPKGFKISLTWFMLAMKQNKKDRGQIFYAFKPDRIEVPLWNGTKKWNRLTIAQMLTLGFLPIWIKKTPENIAKHGSGIHLEE